MKITYFNSSCGFDSRDDWCGHIEWKWWGSHSIYRCHGKVFIYLMITYFVVCILLCLVSVRVDSQNNLLYTCVLHNSYLYIDINTLWCLVIFMYFVISHARSWRGITPLKLLNRISWNYVVSKDIQYAGNSDSLLLGIMPLLNLVATVCPVLVSTIPLKLLNKISWKFLLLGHNMQSVHILRKFWFNAFFWGSYAPLDLEVWPKWNILLKQFYSVTPLKSLNRILHTCNFLFNMDTLCRCAYHRKFWFFSSSGNYVPFEHTL